MKTNGDILKMIYRDNTYNLLIANSSINPLTGEKPSTEDLKKAVEPMILSASGWRKVFAISKDEEDNCEEISKEDKYLAAFIALSLAKHLGCLEGYKVKKTEKKCVLVGMDARPTGPAISDVISRILLACSIEVKNVFIAAAPEIMAYSNLENSTTDAFLYISASHNPIGHNGIKFGKNGGVYTGKESALLAQDFRNFIEDDNAINFVRTLMSALDQKKYEAMLENITSYKQNSLKLYREFALLTASKNQDPNTFLKDLQEKIKNKPIGIVAELNGSARGYSIDKSFYEEIGIKSVFLNDTPRNVVHAIVPEGENLELCRTNLETMHQKDSSFVVGYVPDNDGDRGNLVYIEKTTQKAKILQAQEVFALVAMAELSAVRKNNPNAKLAISINGPTSMRIDDICKALNVEVHRAEVGEANVVELAQQLRDQGYIVRILGEGSNGGNITNPAKVRDPLNTIMTLTSILCDKTIFDTYRKSISYETDELSIENFINSLPKYTTTDAFSNDAKLHVKSSHKDLKNHYEKLFKEFFEKEKEYLDTNYGISSYKVFQMEGTSCKEGIGEEFRSSPYKGGLKVVFYTKDNQAQAFMWMRGSGTEPVFRILIDCKGTNYNLYKYLLSIHTDLILKSDK